MTDAELIESWLHDRTKNTLEGYRRDILQFSRFVNKPLAEVALVDVQRFSSHLKEANLADTTRRRKLNAVRSLFTFAVKHEHIRFNVAAGVKLPEEVRNVASKTLRHDDVLKLIEAGQSERDRLFILTMYATGARVSEVCGMKWQDFSQQSNGKFQAVIKGKGNKVRTVLIPDSVWDKLQLLSKERDRLFPFTRQDAHDIVKSAAKRAGLSNKISCHWLRHSHAHTAVQNGVDLATLRTSMGHSSIAVTDVYLQSFPEEGSSDWLGL